MHAHRPEPPLLMMMMILLLYANAACAEVCYMHAHRLEPVLFVVVIGLFLDEIVRLLIHITDPDLCACAYTSYTAQLSPILDAHTCASCDDAGVLVGALVAIAIVVNVVRVDVMAPRARLKGNGLCRRGLVVTLCVACIACDFALLLVFRNDCYTRFRTATPPVTTSFGPGFILGCLVTVLDAVILAINCVLPHAYIPV